jgi:Putative MetA-pathway of phenol degradation
MEPGRRLGITGMFTNFLVPGDPNKQFFTETTFVLEREFGERAFVFVEFVGDYRLDGGPSYLINSGAGFRITPQQQIDFHVAVGLNENAPAYIVGIGYSYRIDGLF